MHDRDGLSPGDRGDPVADEIRRQQQQDARPSKEEVEQEMRRSERIHAQWKATEVLLERIGAPKNAEVTSVIADILGFDALAQKAGGYHGFKNTHGPGFKKRHQESWEKPDDWPPNHPQAPAPVRPFDDFGNVDNERLRRLKQEAFLTIQEVDMDRFAVARKRMAPFGNNIAVAIEYDGKLHTNDTWDKTFTDEAWSDRFGATKKDKYRSKLRNRLTEATDTPEFILALQHAVEVARAAAEKSRDGPEEAVTATIDGRCSFARAFKDHAQGSGDIYTITDPVRVTVDAIHSLSFEVDGKDVELLPGHAAKAAFEAFAETMEAWDYPMTVEIS